MKNQRSIEELLAEMLRKQDRHEELLSALVRGQSELVEGQLRLIESQLQTNQRIDHLENTMKVGFERVNERVDGITDRFDQLMTILAGNWFKRIIALEDDMEAVKRKVG
jgi:hypothetical protein